MTTDITVFDPTVASYAELAALTGQDVSAGGGSYLPMLKINRDAVDPNNDPLPVGVYAVSGLEQGIVYAAAIVQEGKRTKTVPTKVLFRPFIQSFQYAVWDDDTKKYTNRSVIFTDFMKDAPDEKGGNKCGKINRKQLAGLSEAQLKAQKAIKCSRLVYGTVTFDGITANGDDVKVENQPVLWKMGGDSFMVFGDVLEPLKKSQKLMFNYHFDLGAERKTSGSNTYYVPTVSVDLTSVISFTKDDLDLFKKFQETIVAENNVIMEKHKAALNKSPNSQDDADGVVVEGVVYGRAESLDDDFSQDPF